MGAQGKLFISYRRDDAPGDARGVCDRLGRSFGEANVFMDVDRLLAGQRFDRELEKALSKCDVLIAVIGTRWMELLSACVRDGKRDFVRDEIAAALKRDIVVIPVMTGRETHMPSLPLPEDLPENIRELVLYQKHNIAHETFGRDAAELVAAIKAVLAERRGPRPWRAIAVSAATVLVLTAASVGYWTGMIPGVGSTVHRQNPATSSPTIVAQSESDAVRVAAERARQRAAEEAQRQMEANAAREEAARATAEAKAAGDAATRTAEAQARRTAQAADPKAADNVALTCEDARRSDYEVRTCYEKAAGLGSANAMFRLGVLYEDGHHVDRDRDQAGKWYQKAADAGNEAAKTKLKNLK